jgi:hypothetical protein
MLDYQSHVFETIMGHQIETIRRWCFCQMNPLRFIFDWGGLMVPTNAVLYFRLGTNGRWAKAVSDSCCRKRVSAHWLAVPFKEMALVELHQQTGLCVLMRIVRPPCLSTEVRVVKIDEKRVPGSWS